MKSFKPSNKIWIILISASIFFVFGCTTNELSQNKVKSKIIIKPDSLGLIRDIIVCNNNLILLDGRPLDEYQLKIFDAKTKKLIKSTGKIGTGPSEFKAAMSLNITPCCKSGFSLIDLSTKKMHIYCNSDNGIPQYKKNIQLLEGKPYTPVLKSKNSILSLGLELYSGRLAEYDSTGKLINNIGEIPPGKLDEVPTPAHHQACKGLLKLTPDINKLVISYQFADMIEILNIKGELQKRITCEFEEIPKYDYTVQNNYPIMTLDEENSIFGFLDIEVTNNKIFALYSGKKTKNSDFETDELRIYSIDGKLLSKKILDVKVSQIALDPTNKQMYAVNMCNLPTIYSFKLTELINPQNEIKHNEK